MYIVTGKVQTVHGKLWTYELQNYKVAYKRYEAEYFTRMWRPRRYPPFMEPAGSSSYLQQPETRNLSYVKRI
jgi:hypothetical protein